jgi:hypothetical protein
MEISGRFYASSSITSMDVASETFSYETLCLSLGIFFKKVGLHYHNMSPSA